MMKYLLIEPKTRSVAPNIALMKWARWCEINKHKYQYVRGCVDIDFTPDKIYMSAIFSYHSSVYKKTLDYYIKKYPTAEIVVGGVFPTLHEEWFEKFNNPFFGTKRVDVHCGLHPEIEHLIPKYDVNIIDEPGWMGSLEHNREHKIVTYSSRGCVYKCGYCAVPKLEGDMKSFDTIKETLKIAKVELPKAETVVLYDNNFTAHEFWEDICKELLEFDLPIDIHGLHVSQFTEEQAKVFAKLKWGGQGKSNNPMIRFGFDKIKYEPDVWKAVELVKKYDIQADIFMYLLYNWTDSLEDFWKRVVISHDMAKKFNTKIYLFPQRYEPLTNLKRNQHIGKKWDEETLLGLGRFRNWAHNWIIANPNGRYLEFMGGSYESFVELLKQFAADGKFRYTWKPMRKLPKKGVKW